MGVKESSERHEPEACISRYIHKMINSYNFGRIIVDGRTYSSDIIIYPDGRIQDSWWRREGHKLSIEDIVQLIESVPEIIVVGTGAYGYMQPEKGLEDYLRARQIGLRCAPSGEATGIYNTLYVTRRVGACFHLTC